MIGECNVAAFTCYLKEGERLHSLVSYAFRFVNSSVFDDIIGIIMEVIGGGICYIRS